MQISLNIDLVIFVSTMITLSLFILFIMFYLDHISNKQNILYSIFENHLPQAIVLFEIWNQDKRNGISWNIVQKQNLHYIKQLHNVTFMHL